MKAILRKQNKTLGVPVEAAAQLAMGDDSVVVYSSAASISFSSDLAPDPKTLWM